MLPTLRWLFFSGVPAGLFALLVYRTDKNREPPWLVILTFALASLAGVAAHSMLPLSAPLTSAFGLVLMMAAHSVGWPVVEGGSARLTDALVDELTSLGGQVETGRWVQSLDSLPRARAVVLDVTPRQLVAMAGDRLDNPVFHAPKRKKAASDDRERGA